VGDVMQNLADFSFYEREYYYTFLHPSLQCIRFCTTSIIAFFDTSADFESYKTTAFIQFEVSKAVIFNKASIALLSS